MTFARCLTCVMPNSRPDTQFTDGICSACISYARRKDIDWPSRLRELEGILERGRNDSGYDCIVPSSGGKDSTWQTLMLIEMGARPLVVTASTCHVTEMGRKNIANLARFATTIEVSPQKSVRAKLNKLGLQLVGDISWPEHLSINAVPFRIARDFGIQLIFYGEAPLNQYGSPAGFEDQKIMTKRWITEFGGHLGLRPSDIVGKDGITARDMDDYTFPKNCDAVAYWMGQFIPWDSHRNATVAREHGMLQKLPCQANWWEFENVDNGGTGAHDYFGWLKYGYGRACAQVSVDIRSGLLTREEGLEIVRERDGIFPVEYAGVSFYDLLENIEMTETEFFEIAESFTASELFVGTRNHRATLKEFA